MPTQKSNLNDSDVELILNRLLLVLPTKKEIEGMEKRLAKKYDRVINQVDKVMGELTKKRDEQEILAQHSKDHTDQLDDHEERITSLESVVIANA